MRNLNELPTNLPRPTDDGKALHLLNMLIPSIELVSTSGETLNIQHLFQEPTVLFIYPRAGSPLVPNTNPDLWDNTPGARGCTPQSCGFRDRYHEFKALGFKVLGLSIQTPAVQKEFAERNKIPFEILSDCRYELTDKLSLPTFVFEGQRLIKRMAWIITESVIKKVFYPVFPPDKNATEVLAWLKHHYM